MTFWCMVFHETFNDGFWDFLIEKFVNGVFIYSPSHSSCDGDEGSHTKSLTYTFVTDSSRRNPIGIPTVFSVHFKIK
jgi:hypothetical protein